jgi:hypothetical protein
VIAPGQGTVTSDSFGTIINFTTTGNTILGDATTDTLTVGVTGIVKDSSGNVGIGNASPSGYKLAIGDGSSNRGRIMLKGATSGNYPEINIDDSMNTSGKNYQLYSTGGVLKVANQTDSGAVSFVSNAFGIGLGDNAAVDGTGIRFPATQNASSNANTLDDYEEGTWTPAFGYSGGNGTMAISYGNQYGWYTKTGNVVYLRMDMRITSFSKGTASGIPWIVGLPFTPQNNSGYGSAIFLAGIYQWTFSSTPPLASVAQNGTSAIYLQRMVNNSAYSNLDDPDGDSMIFQTVIYQV